MFTQVLVEGIINGSIIALIAMGIALIWGVMDVLNFAQGEFLMVGMYLTFSLNKCFGLDPLISLPICAVVMFLFGIVIHKLLIRRILNGPPLCQILLTFSLGIVLVNLALATFGGEYRTIPKLLFEGSIALGAVTINKAKLVPFFTCIVVVVLLFWFINHTRTGKAIQATSMNKDAAALVGINPELAYTIAFGLASALTGIAGCVLTYYYYIFPGIGSTFANFGFIAVAMGGFGSIPGALIGGLIMGITDMLTGVYINPAFKFAAVCVLYIVVVSIRPKGLFGW
jgi:branched-chain amino acid transport system permease protein